MYWNQLTFLGDSTLLLPCAGSISIVFFLKKKTRTACWQWLVSLCIAIGIVCTSKLAFMCWKIGSRDYNFTGISGHSLLSATIWPVIFWFIFSRTWKVLRLLSVTIGYSLALAVSISRLIIQVHSLSEVLSGFMMGCLISSSFLSLQNSRDVRIGTFSNLEIFSIICVILLTFVSKNFTIHNPVKQMILKVAPNTKVYTRKDL